MSFDILPARPVWLLLPFICYEVLPIFLWLSYLGSWVGRLQLDSREAVSIARGLVNIKIRPYLKPTIFIALPQRCTCAKDKRRVARKKC